MRKKVIKLETSLSLDKETISRLNEEQLNTLEGGLASPTTLTCNGSDFQQTNASCSACSCNVFDAV